MVRPTLLFFPVSNDIKAIRTEWKKSRIRDFDQLVTITDKRLDFLMREAFAAWEASKQPQEITKVVNNGSGKRAEKTIRQTAGDPRFLELIRRCLEDRRTLQALDAPPRTEAIESEASEWARQNALRELLRRAEEEGRHGPSNVIDSNDIEAEIDNADDQ